MVRYVDDNLTDVSREFQARHAATETAPITQCR